MAAKVNLFWFRRDLRLTDNKALHEALSKDLPVVPFFIFDKQILDELEEKNDRRVSFIYHALLYLQQQLQHAGSTIHILYDYPLEAIKKILRSYEVNSVFANHDYEPYARERDEAINQMLQVKGIQLKTFKDQVIFEKSEVVKDDGEPYRVFTPYAKKWLSLLKEHPLKINSSENLFRNFLQQPPKKFPSLKQIGFMENTESVSKELDESIVRNYNLTRNIPSLPGTSRMGIHLRFGTVSVRELVAKAIQLNNTFLNELIWREFFMQMLWHQPRLIHEACKKEYDKIKWRNNEKEFETWCMGTTGYPIVDAGMRELNETGFMHNRVRMITASFLVKHLLIDWRWGEAWFAKKLLDYELSSNNGNWQWVAGCGCDAAPYFRIFSPAAQTKRFDPQLIYIRKWIPEFDSPDYPMPIVEHELARERCLKTYKAALRP